MTRTQEAAMRLALEALEEATSYTSCTTWSPSMTEACAAAASALRAALVEDAMQKFTDVNQELEAALEEPVQEPVSVTDLQQALVETNLIDPDAIDDPEGYDDGSTVAQIDALHGMLFRPQRPAEPVQEPKPPLGQATTDDIERMAREVRGHPYTNRYTPGEVAFAFSIDRLEHFFSLVAAAEREACAKVCDDIGNPWALDCAFTIRARSNP